MIFNRHSFLHTYAAFSDLPSNNSIYNSCLLFMHIDYLRIKNKFKKKSAGATDTAPRPSSSYTKHEKLLFTGKTVFSSFISQEFDKLEMFRDEREKKTKKSSQCMSKKQLPILYSKLLYETDNYFLDIQYIYEGNNSAKK